MAKRATTSRTAQSKPLLPAELRGRSNRMMEYIALPTQKAWHEAGRDEFQKNLEGKNVNRNGALTKISIGFVSLAIRYLCVWVLAIWSVVSSAAGYQILSDTSFPSNSPDPSVQSVKATKDGGYLIVGRAGLNELRLIKTLANGTLAWERIITAPKGRLQDAIFALDASEGGFWVIGTAKETVFMSDTKAEAALRTKLFTQFADISYLAKFSSSGEMESRLPLGLRKKFEGSRFVCGMTMHDGIVLVGSKYVFYENQPPHSGRELLVQPWAVKLSTSGELLWETLISDYKESIFHESYFDTKSCGGPYPGEGGTITFGLTVRRRTVQQVNGNRVVTGPGVWANAVRTYLIVQLDPRGKQVALQHIDGQILGRILPDANGFLVVSNPSPAFRGGIQRTWMGRDLKVVRTEETRPEGYSMALRGALPGFDGGIHLTGFHVVPPDERGQLAIGYLTPKGELVGMRAIATAMSGWDVRGFDSGYDKAEVAVVLKSDAMIRLLRFKYQYK